VVPIRGEAVIRDPRKMPRAAKAAQATTAAGAAFLDAPSRRA